MIITASSRKCSEFVEASDVRTPCSIGDESIKPEAGMLLLPLYSYAERKALAAHGLTYGQRAWGETVVLREEI